MLNAEICFLRSERRLRRMLQMTAREGMILP